ncbi:hypothetical protein DDD_0111 [Nonlabens dokdonensis DSW-6]|uniref:Uncharacterized protein n=1 Tax=Nonlabens dokdonensis (strain DSM 17205 / KCTC 12402 / DSW-6) TaxID=592029 RepID=L7W8Q9_NONDD|nr:hypothetical protein DDD_0111 [Nonlabens dokdonensis DSW-6]
MNLDVYRKDNFLESAFAKAVTCDATTVVYTIENHDLSAGCAR